MRVFVLFWALLCLVSICNANPLDSTLQLSDSVQDIQDADQNSFTYDGESLLSQEQTEQLLSDFRRKRERAILEASEFCVECSHAELLSQDNVDVNGDGDDDNRWEVVILARVGIRTNMSGGVDTISAIAAGGDQWQSDFSQIESQVTAGNFTQDSLQEIISNSTQEFDGDHQSAMAYVAAMGRTLNRRYGDSNAGSFIGQFEQFGAAARGEGSVGQCSDIHYAMLRTYNQMMGGKENTKAYLVNFQTGDSLHHTNLVIEKDGELFIVDYGNVQKVRPGQLDPLQQSHQAGQSIAYRVFDEGTEINDKMIGHIDTPLGMMLREVSTGQSTYNPFRQTNYGLFSADVESPNDTFGVRTFVGELGNGHTVFGIAVRVEGQTELPAGFSLDSHFSTAYAYATRKYRVNDNVLNLDSHILYFNTGLGLNMPELNAGDFSFRASTRLTLEGGVWMKSYSDDSNPNASNDVDPFEGDGNLFWHTNFGVTWAPSDQFKVDLDTQVEVIPTFGTAFPSSTDGSSGADGLTNTLGATVNNVNTSLTGTFTTSSGIDLFAGIQHQYTNFGHLGQANIGTSYQGLTASAFIQGALDREQTPGFVPGAQRQIGANINYCTSTNGPLQAVCAGGQFQHSLEGQQYFGGGQLELKF